MRLCFWVDSIDKTSMHFSTEDLPRFRNMRKSCYEIDGFASMVGRVNDVAASASSAVTAVAMDNLVAIIYMENEYILRAFAS